MYSDSCTKSECISVLEREGQNPSARLQKSCGGSRSTHLSSVSPPRDHLSYTTQAEALGPGQGTFAEVDLTLGTCDNVIM